MRCPAATVPALFGAPSVVLGKATGRAPGMAAAAVVGGPELAVDEEQWPVRAAVKAMGGGMHGRGGSSERFARRVKATKLTCIAQQA